jgi:amino acid transporter
MADNDRRAIGYWGAVAIGVGGMVGGGIFAVLGLAVELAHGGTPVAFVLAGVVALLTTYSYVRLSLALPSQGGTVTFLNRAFGTGLATGALNVLLWLSYVVMLSLYAFAFGSYAAALMPGGGPFEKHLAISAVIVLATGLNSIGSRVLGEAETWIVGIKVAILLFFVAVGLFGLDPGRLSPAAWTGPVQLFAGGMIIFLAYEGFELIANTAGDLGEPERTLPRAYYSAVLFVIALYVLVAAVAVGNLPVPQIVQARDYALAQAARPFLGQAGFTLIAIAALLSTASAINATLYGAARLSYVIARDGELPEVLEHKIWSKPLEGLFLTAIVTLLVANLFDLSSISTMGSAGFLLIFGAVNAANLRMVNRTGSNRWIPLAGLLACAVALAALLWHTWTTSPARILVLAAMVVLSVAIEIVYRLATGREIRLTHFSRPTPGETARANQGA